jgi:HK97 family phage portal protein
MSILSWLGKTIGLTDHGFFGAYYGATNNTGQVVTTNSALSVAAAWACIRLLSESVGIIPLGVYRKSPSGGREALSDHPAYMLTRVRPNDEMTSDELWQAVAASLATEGNALLMPLFYDGRITSLEFIPWRDVNVTRSPAWVLTYQFQWHGKRYELTADRVIHFRGFGMGGDVGLSAIRHGAQTLGIAMAADKSAGRSFRGGASKAGLIQSQKVLVGDQREAFDKMLATYQGTDSADKIMVLPPGFEWKETGITMADLQLLQSRGFSVEQVCSIFRVPPFMIGHTEKATSWGTGLEQQVIAFLTFALAPYLKRIEERLKLQLLSPLDQRNGVYIEFNREALLQADSAARAALYSVMTQNGLMTRNEIRDKENLPRMEGGDDLTVQSALVRLRDLAKIAGVEGATGGGADAQRARQSLRAWLDVQDVAPPEPARQE